jgi:hypothetical protein
MNVTNREFLTTIFGNDVDWCHVTDFPHDPGAIPDGKHLVSWMGDYYSRYQMSEGTNQYFTVSTFYCGDKGEARRRKALYRQTHCIVLDDVREKLSQAQAIKLPPPTWILETSEGSEQWGYLLSVPCTDPHQVNNLIDGFILSDLCPQNKDSGMAGTTRYVRLPEGTNNKASKLVDGLPFSCVMQQWNPFTTTTMAQLAAPFGINIHRARREERVDGAADVSDHPILNLPDIIHIKEVRSDGRFDITCPWVDQHTDADDSGAAIFTNSDGSMGFKCHHGGCIDRTGRDLLREIESKNAGFTQSLAMWQFMRTMDAEMGFTEAASAPVAAAPANFMDAVVSVDGAPSTFIDSVPAEPVLADLSSAFNMVSRAPRNSAEQNLLLSEFLKVVDSLPKIEQTHWHKSVAHEMGYSKAEFKEVLTDLRKNWYGDRLADCSSFSDLVFVGEQNMFYSMSKKIFYSPESAQNSYSHEDAEFRKSALQNSKVTKVDKIDYAPSLPTIFSVGACSYVNIWSDKNQPRGVAGDVTPWLNHFDVIGWGEYKEHVVNWMAYTLQYPEIKINHALLFGGAEGIGKDFIMSPLINAMADNSTTIDGDSLVNDFSSYLKGNKLIHINEIELGDHQKAKDAAFKLKRLTSEPPHTLLINEKGIRPYEVRNICNVMMGTNSAVPIKLTGMSRRLYAMWCALKIRGVDGNVMPEWEAYWTTLWQWMNDDGLQIVINHLRTIDVSAFKAKQSPPVTEFLRDIVDDSKSSLQRLLEHHIGLGLGMFECDILTSGDMVKALRTADIVNDNDVFKVDSKFITAHSVGSVLKQANDFVNVRSSTGRYWLLRNAQEYANLKPVEFDKIYKTRYDEVRTKLNFKVVNDMFNKKVDAV